MTRLLTAAAMALLTLQPSEWPTGSLVHRVGAVPLFHPATRVVLFMPAATDPLVARIDAELAAVGIAVRRMKQPPDSQIEAVVGREIASGASAAIRIIPRSRGTEVWTGDTTAQLSSRRSIRADTSDAALSVIALRTVEFLRASLLEVKSGGSENQNPLGDAEGSTNPKANAIPAPARPSTAVTTTTTTPAALERIADKVLPLPTARDETDPARMPPAEPRTRRTDIVEASRSAQQPIRVPDRRVEGASGPGGAARAGKAVPDLATPSVGVIQLAVGPAILASPRAGTPIGAIAVMVRGPIAGPVGAEALAMLPVFPARVTRASGSIELAVALFGGAATFRLTPASGPWLVDLALGGSVTLVRTTGSGTGAVGTPPVPNVGSTDSTWMITGHARLGGGYRLTRWLLCRADLIAGLLPSRIFFGSRVSDTARRTDPSASIGYGSWGPAFAGATVALQAAW